MAVASAITAFFAPRAVAAPTWLPPIGISAESQVVGNPQVAVDASGDAVAVWERASGRTGTGVIEASTRPVGGSWSEPPTRLSADAQDAFVPQVAVDPGGDAVVVWQQARDQFGNYVIDAATRPAGGIWSYAPTPLSTDQSAYEPQVAVDASGEAVAVWEGTNEKTGSYPMVVEAATLVSGGTWSDPTPLSADTQNARSPEVAVDARGDAVAVWRRSDDKTGKSVIEAATRPSRGIWSDPPLRLSADTQDAFDPRVAVDRRGDAVAVWQRRSGKSHKFVIEAATRLAAGAWSVPTRLSGDARSAFVPRVAVDARGDAVVVWERNGGKKIGRRVIEAATRPSGGSWTHPPTLLSAATEDASNPQVAVDPRGDAVAVWERTRGKTERSIVEAATHPAGGDWSDSLTRLSGDTARETELLPQVAVDACGDAVAVWGRTSAKTDGSVVETATLRHQRIGHRNRDAGTLVNRWKR
ncbi:MAG TPA: hypothetical protein VGC32_15120 [Solirubrobacterales bacterium]